MNCFVSAGRIDRKIEFPLPDEKTKRRIFGIHTGRMTLAADVNLEEYILAKDDLSGADIKVGFRPWLSSSPSHCACFDHKVKTIGFCIC